MSRVGTSHFLSFDHVERYYRKQGLRIGPNACRAKVDSGEVSLGKPPERNGATIEVDFREGRYFYEECDPCPA